MKLPGGLWITTEHAVATESGEPVDPVQAALWGFGRTTVNEEPALRCKLVDCDGSEEAVQLLANLIATPIEEPELALRQGKLLASRSGSRARLPFTGVVWRTTAPAQDRAPTSSRVETEIANLLSAVHTVSGSQNGSVKLPNGL